MDKVLRVSKKLGTKFARRPSPRQVPTITVPFPGILGQEAFIWLDKVILWPGMDLPKETACGGGKIIL